MKALSGFYIGSYVKDGFKLLYVSSTGGVRVPRDTSKVQISARLRP